MRLMVDQLRAEEDMWGREVGRFASRCIPPPDTPVIVADDVAAWLDARKATETQSASWVAASLFEGPLQLAPAPYEAFWVESTHTHTDIHTGKLGGYKLGQYVTTEALDAGWTRVIVTGWVLNRFGLQPPHLSLIYEVDNDGKVHTHDRVTTAPGETLTEREVRTVEDTGRQDEAEARWVKLPAPLRWNFQTTPWTEEEERDWLHGRDAGKMPSVTMAVGHTENVIATCAFMVCKNVRPERHEVPDRVARKRGRASGKPVTRSYSVINLPGYREWRTAAGVQRGAGEQVLPAHFVRAHPKTYRRNDDGSGGLGRHHVEGTFLWSPQFRGNPAAGVRVPLVQVTPPADAAAAAAAEAEPCVRGTPGCSSLHASPDSNCETY